MSAYWLFAALSFAADPCGNGSVDGRPRACLVREVTLPASSSLAVDARENGGIAVTGQSVNGIRVIAKIATTARSAERAQALAEAVRVKTGDGKVSAEGPAATNGEWWSVSFEVTAPPKTDLSLISGNGGLSVTGMDARVSLATVNGGIALQDVNGEVSGRTTNGGVDVSLSGSGWKGTGLDVETTNGGISVTLPRTYAADLDVGTVHGGVSVDAPIARQGGRVTAELGGGGPPIRLTTTNGAVSVAAKN